MVNFFALLKVNMLSFLGINKILRAKKRFKFAGVIILVLALSAFAALVCYFGYSLADMLRDLQKNLIPVVTAFSSASCIFYSFYAVGSVLYGGKDFDMLSAMPIKNRTITASAFAAIYAGDLIISSLIVAPSFFVYSSSFALRPAEAVRMILTLLFSPFAPIAVAVIAGTFFELVSSRFRHRNLAQIVLTAGAIAAIYAAYFSSDDGLDIVAAFSRFNVLLPFMTKGFSDWGYAAAFMGISFGAIAVVFAANSALYKRIRAAISYQKVKRNYKLKKQYGARSPFNALFLSELKRIFSVPVYALNALIGPILSILISVGMIVIMNALSKMLADDAGELVSAFLSFAPAIFCFCFMLFPPSSCSVSMEGAAFWIKKSAPVKMRSVFFSKIAASLCVLFPAAVAAGIVLGAGLGASALSVLLLTLCSAFTAILGSVSGLFFNLLMPNLKWTSPAKAVKRSASVFLSMMFGFAAAALSFSLIDVIGGAEAYLAIITGGEAALSAILFAVICIFGEKLLEKRLKNT